MHIVMIGGHLTPALATMDEIVKLENDVRISFVGRKYALEGDTELSNEFKIMKERGVPFFSIKAGRLQRRFSKHTIPSLLRVPVGFFQSLWILRSIKPDVVVSFGGYVAVPVCVAAKILGVRVVTHEQTLVPGLANKIISYFADVIALSFDFTRKYYEARGKRLVVTGNPIRRDIFELRSTMPFGGIDMPMVFVSCGNQGSHFVNQLVYKHIFEILSFCVVFHQTGKNSLTEDYIQGQRIMNSLPVEFCGRYIVTDYVGANDIGAVFARSELVVSRAGVNTMCDLLALGKKGVMIPGHREQEANARFFESLGMGVCLLPGFAEGRFVNVLSDTIAKKIPQSVKKVAMDSVKQDAALALAKIIVSLR